MVVTWLLAGLGAAALGARRAGVRHADEAAAWCIAGVVSGAGWAWLAAHASPWLPAIPCGAAWVAAALAPALDRVPGRLPSATSLVLKLLATPITTTLALLVAMARHATGAPWQLREGALFVHAGRGRAALVTGAVVWTQESLWTGTAVEARWVAHEAHHTRNAAVCGELGFYLVYATLGALWARLHGAPWNALARPGRGQPFERTAYALSDRG